MNVTSVFVDQTEYSRYHSDISVITATVTVASPTDGGTLTATLNRLDGYGTVCSKTITTSAASTTYTVSFDLNVDTFDTNMIYRAKAGDYTVNITDPSNLVTQSGMFAVSIVPVKELREEWTKGVTFYDYEILEPRVQPQLITGVTVTEVSADHLKGPFALAFVHNTSPTNSTLSWNGGQAVPVSGSAPVDLLLMDGENEDFIMVHVNPLQLPASSQNETLYIDNGRIKDRAMIDQIRRATDDIQFAIMTRIEPNIITTDPTPGVFHDGVGIPETYYRPRTQNKWLSFKLPYANVLDAAISGYFNRGKVADVPRDWTVWDELTGICELVPSNAAQVLWQFYNGIFVLAYLYQYASIPGFWHYTITTGLRDLNDDRAVVREAIAKKAATELLNSAGSAYRAGYASQSTSRDGISESEGYTSSATFGTYGGHFTSYKEWLDKNIPKMKKRFAGIQYVTI